MYIKYFFKYILVIKCLSGECFISTGIEFLKTYPTNLMLVWNRFVVLFRAYVLFLIIVLIE